MGGQRRVPQHVRKKPSQRVAPQRAELPSAGVEQPEVDRSRLEVDTPDPIEVQDVAADSQADVDALTRALARLGPQSGEAVILNLEHWMSRFLAMRGGQRGHTLETADRWIKMMNEMTEGHGTEISRLFKTFDDVQYDGMIVLTGVEFTSLCEHHLLPFTGRAHVAYIPEARSGRIVGISKLARLVEAHARRLQVQERMTQNIANDIMKHLRAQGVGVRLEGVHSCMTCRGVKKKASMVTQTLLGVLQRAEVKQEFNELVG
jgi:GTP cyclohydrolase I